MDGFTLFLRIFGIGAFENYLKLLETSGNFRKFLKTFMKFPETSKHFAGDGNFQPLDEAGHMGVTNTRRNWVKEDSLQIWWEGYQ